MIIFARYIDIPFVAKAKIINPGIIKINVWFFSINIFSIAGSNSQAIEEVLVATNNEKNTASRILFRYFFV